MGIGPVPAVRKLLARAELTVDEFEFIELDDAIARLALARLRDLGMTSARLDLSAAHRPKRKGGRHARCTMCAGVGRGRAIVQE